MTDAEDIDSLPAASRPYAHTLRQRTGRLLGIHRRMAASTVVIAAYCGISAAIAECGTFGARTREEVALAVGNQDGCEYCQAAHAVSARRAGLADDEILQIRSGEIAFDEKLAALADIARNAAAHVGNAPDALRAHALESGWSQADLEELFAHIAANLYTNYFNHYAGTELDLPPAPPLP